MPKNKSKRPEMTKGDERGMEATLTPGAKEKPSQLQSESDVGTVTVLQAVQSMKEDISNQFDTILAALHEVRG